MRLYLLQMALNEASGTPVPAYLIQTDDGSNVLVDTGFARDAVGRAGWRLGEQDLIVNQLARLGLTPGDIRFLVCTHFDSDHAGGHDAFTAAELVVQRAHYEAARQGPHAERFAASREHWGRPDLRYRLIDGDTELLPGVELIESGGHVPGHQSVLVRLPQTGPILLAIDAIPRALGEYTADTRPIGPFDLDEAGVRASTRKLLDLAEREGVALIVHGHDPGQWATLKKAPEFYS